MPVHHSTSGDLVSSGATIGVADEPPQFLERACSLHDGAAAVASMGAAKAPASIFLASWGLELGLKAFLAAKGQRKKELKPIQHDLVQLWTEAANRGLPVPTTPPRWCELLGDTHMPPDFHQRYPTQTPGSVAPNLATTVAELAELLRVIRASL